MGSEILSFGRHAGKTYDQMIEQHADYCQWAVMTIEQDAGSASPELRRFAEYVVRKEQEAVLQHEDRKRDTEWMNIQSSDTEEDPHETVLGGPDPEDPIGAEW